MKMFKNRFSPIGSILACCLLAVAAGCGAGSPKDGEYSFHILTTNDIHGSFFDSTYVGGGIRNSLYAVKWTADSVRTANGAGNVILIDAGDILQGDNAAYYYNYVDTVSPHIYPKMAAYMGYDAAVLGNHDIETGHKVYDRVVAQMEEAGVPFLTGNAIRNDNGKPYFQVSTILKRNGVKIAVLGFNNANISNWLAESLWEGMSFKNLIPTVQEEVDKVIAEEKPHVVIVAVHSGTGDGSGKVLESQGLDLFKTLNGVDFLVCAHDHRPHVELSENICLLNAGQRCRNLGHGTINLTIENGKVVKKTLDGELIHVDRKHIDKEMQADFHEEFTTVKEFSTQVIGELKTDLRTSDAYIGMSDYLNLIHTLALTGSEARISFAAPLTYNGFVKAGSIIYNDLFTIYPYENQMNLISMTGKEIKLYLEASYDSWINTVKGQSDHVLRIRQSDDPRNNQKSWSFMERSYNFDSAGGLVYTVDVTKPKGERIVVESFADGKPFKEDEEYPVAMTSYRANGGGGLLRAAGVDTGRIEERIIEYYPEFRVLLYDYLKAKGSIDPAVIGDRSIIGQWSFVPEKIAGPALERDLGLLFPNLK